MDGLIRKTKSDRVCGNRRKQTGEQERNILGAWGFVRKIATEEQSEKERKKSGKRKVRRKGPNRTVRYPYSAMNVKGIDRTEGRKSSAGTKTK